MLDGKEKIKLIAVIMRHLGGYHHGYFHHAGYGSRGIAPGRLIYRHASGWCRNCFRPSTACGVSSLAHVPDDNRTDSCLSMTCRPCRTSRATSGSCTLSLHSCHTPSPRSSSPPPTETRIPTRSQFHSPYIHNN